MTADIRRDCIAGFAAHGLDGKGKLGFPGYIQFLATKHPKAAVRVIEKLLPLTVNGTGLSGPHISAVNVISIPSGEFLSSLEMAKLQTPGLIEHAPQLEQYAPLVNGAPLELDCSPEPAACAAEAPREPERQEPVPSETDDDDVSTDELMRRAGAIRLV